MNDPMNLMFRVYEKAIAAYDRYSTGKFRESDKAIDQLSERERRNVDLYKAASANGSQRWISSREAKGVIDDQKFYERQTQLHAAVEQTVLLNSISYTLREIKEALWNVQKLLEDKNSSGQS